ncbi:MAG: hypothetical protein GX879_01670 [Bacteroidales bacterium]|nr:hypothetical protein [Bacteroidales bacterium]
MKIKKLSLRIIPIIVIVILSLGIFWACEKENTRVQKWECIFSDGVNSDGVKITLHMYQSKNKYYTTVSGTPQANILFGDDLWVRYQMVDNRMLITKIGDSIIDPNKVSFNWIIRKPSNDVMIMEYEGLRIFDLSIIYDYEFKLK